MTLGPKFFFSNKMAITRRPRNHFEFQALIQKALDEIYNLAGSNQDLKQFLKSDILGFAGSVFLGFFFKKRPTGACGHCLGEEKGRKLTKQHKRHTINIKTMQRQKRKIQKTKQL